MKADINLHQHVGLFASANHRLRPLLRHGQMIDDERELGPVEQRDHPVGICGTERIRQPDVRDTCIRKHFRLAKLRAANANGAAFQLPSRDERTLVCLGVRPEANAARIRLRLHAIEIAGRLRAIDQDRGSAE